MLVAKFFEMREEKKIKHACFLHAREELKNIDFLHAREENSQKRRFSSRTCRNFSKT
jgi:hypothetical protein